MEKKEIKESASLNIILNRADHIPSEVPSLTTEDFPQGLFKPSSLDKEYQGPSFASMTKKAPSGTLGFSPSRKSPNRLIVDENENEFSDSVGWTLDLEGMALDEDNTKKWSVQGKKKTSKKISLLSNGSLRRRT